MLTSIISIAVVAVVINIVVNYILYRVDKGPCAPNFLPDAGADELSLKAVPGVLAEYGVKDLEPFNASMPLPSQVRAFFSVYRSLKIDYIIDLGRSYLGEPYVENANFVRVGLMSCENDLLVRKSTDDECIYIVGSEDGDPRRPELFATSFANLIAISWHDKKQLEAFG